MSSVVIWRFWLDESSTIVRLKVPIRNLVPVRNLLFDLRPKRSRKDLFDRERELEELERASSKYPLIMLLGVRRVGKTSVAYCFLENRKGFLVDLRGVRSRAELYGRLAEGLRGSIGALRKFLRGIRGIKVMGAEVELKWRGMDSLSFTGLLTELNRAGNFTVVLDEVQSLRPPLSSEVRSLLAYAYDNLDKITIVVTGSEVGILKDFLKLSDPSSPLYGRYVHKVEVGRFSKGELLDFLRRGFMEEGINPPKKDIEEAIDLFDRIVGWLVLFSRLYSDGGDLEGIVEVAIKTVTQELAKLSKREKAVLKAIAKRVRS